MAKALAHLATLGHARVAYISGPPQSWANEQRLRSVEKAALAHDVALDVIAAGTASFSSGTEVVDILLAAGPSACIAFDDVLAQGICYGLAQRNIDVPREMSVVGCDDIMSFPRLTTVSSPSTVAGRKAVELLIHSLKSNLSPDTRVVLDTDLVHYFQLIAKNLVAVTSLYIPRLAGVAIHGGTGAQKSQKSMGEFGWLKKSTDKYPLIIVR